MNNDKKPTTPEETIPTPDTPPTPTVESLPPADTTPVTPVVETNNTLLPASPPKKSKKPLIITLAALAIIAIGAGIYFYITNQPQFMLDQAAQQLSQQKNFASKLTAQIGTGNEAKTIQGDVAVRGDDSNKDNGELIIGIGADANRVGLTARLVESNLYWRFDTLENLGRLLESLSLGTEESYAQSEFKPMIDQINNIFFFATKEELAEFSKSAGQDSVTGTIKPDELKTVANIYTQHKFIKADKQYNDETIDGENSAHFDVKVDVNEYVAFLKGVKDANLQTFKVTDQDIEEAKKEAEKSQEAKVDIWVARFSNKLKQLRFSSTKQGEEGSLTLTLPANPPKSEKIEKPTDAKPMSEFMSTVFGGSALQSQETELTEEEQQLLNEVQ